MSRNSVLADMASQDVTAAEFNLLDGVQLIATDAIIGEDAQTKIDFETANEIHFDTNNSEAMVIDTNGKVGIGVSAPNKTGHLNLVATSAGASLAITFQDSGGGLNGGNHLGDILFGGSADGSNWGYGAKIRSEVQSNWSGTTDTPADLQFHTVADGGNTMTERMRIFHNGNVGIGTTAPGYKLHLKTWDSGHASVTDFTPFLALEHNTTTGIVIGTPNTGEGKIYFADPDNQKAGAINYSHGGIGGKADSMQFYTAGAERMRVSSDGNVTEPYQASFNVVGDTLSAEAIGTSYATVGIWTERFDTGTNFASDQFTAPVTGKYILNAHLYVYGYSNGDTLYMKLFTSNYGYVTEISATDGGDSMLEISVVADMDASDVAKVEIKNNTAARGNVASSMGYFSGMLIG